MKAGDRRYTVLWNQSGQLAPYKPTVRDFTIKIEWCPYANPFVEEWVPNDLAEAIVDRAAKGVGCNFYTSAEKPDWHLPVLKSKTKISPGEWRYRIEEAYTD